MRVTGYAVYQNKVQGNEATNAEWNDQPTAWVLPGLD